MATIQLLKNAPIKEAIIDIQVRNPEGLEVESLRATTKMLDRGYSNESLLYEGKIDLQIDGIVPKEARINQQSLGFRYESSNGRQVVQFRSNGFTFSLLAPYSSWEDMLCEATRLWELYLELTSPSRVLRVATRYINIISIPLPIKDFGEYLTTPPHIPQGLPNSLSSFLTRIVSQAKEGANATAIVTLSLDGEDRNVLPIYLDIDVFEAVDIDPSQKDVLLEKLDSLRRYKNDIFFKYITDETARRFQ